MKNLNQIILIGFMGSGKTTVAHALSQKLLFKYIETDFLILKKSKRKSINEIFEKDGETVFREMEMKVIKKIAGLKKTIIATGGGAIINKINIDRLKNTGYVICLKVSFVEAQKRLAKINDRPLFKNIKKAKKLYELREPLYEAYANIVIQTDGKNIEDVTHEIIERIN